MTDFYARWELPRVVNAATSWTRLGGTLMAPEVLTAMAAAATRFVDMEALARAAGAELAALTRNDDATVTSGGAAALALAAMAFRNRGELTSIPIHPSSDELPDEIVMHSCHRNPYDRAVELAGARVRTIGNVLQTFEWELEAALGPRTAGVLYVVGARMPPGALPLERVVEIAHERGVPVLVDAAAQVPPVENLWHFSQECGADLVAFSGGKELRGPQASGLLVGSARWIEAVRANAAPHQRLGRALKVGKEEIFGLVEAVRRFVVTDHDAEFERLRAICVAWGNALRDIPGVDVFVSELNAAGARLPRLEVNLRGTGRTSAEVADALWRQSPRIAVWTRPPHLLCLEPALVDAADVELVREGMVRAMAGEP